MEGELPPVGDERKSNRLHLVTPEAQTELTPDRPEGNHSLSLVSEAELRKRRKLMEWYLAENGMPEDVQDLSVSAAEMHELAKSHWGASITVHFPEGTFMHPGLRDLVERNLTGRGPFVTMSQTSLRADFLLPDGSDLSRSLATKFAYELALLLDGIPIVSVGEFTPTGKRGPSDGSTTAGKRRRLRSV